MSRPVPTTASAKSESSGSRFARSGEHRVTEGNRRGRTAAARARQTGAVNHRYSFAGTWRVPADPDVVFAELERLDRYPLWWPQVRLADRIDDDTCTVVVRSRLPYSLRMTAHRMSVDRERGVLAARLSGDLAGVTGWRLVRTAGGTLIEFSEDVEVHRPLLRRLAWARPAFRANHAWMMHCGQRGLRHHLLRPRSEP